MFNALKTLLLLALLAVTGEAAAVHCGSENGHEPRSEIQVAEQAPAGNPHHGHTEPVAATAVVDKSAHCSHGQCEDTHTTSAPHQNCDGSCSCCPGHCANAIPVSATIAEFISFLRSHTAYRPLDSTPAPESTIRPPIPA
ncbi:hypothetical protein ACONUD_18460 [Microbulbifer harenosus]|uniref:CopL family metal-binding regulatory protein n=1 Tax=Microbulbifer harenosus TaxID=2576840 RepID=A0ABY2UDB2_9GAMM|nr:hypothetical protein [Microbulbifer harenosus]TLM73999.1 hypothetical protein FDY93_18325 [Microbulbifer harenosus]